MGGLRDRVIEKMTGPAWHNTCIVRKVASLIPPEAVDEWLDCADDRVLAASKLAQQIVEDHPEALRLVRVNGDYITYHRRRDCACPPRV